MGGRSAMPAWPASHAGLAGQIFFVFQGPPPDGPAGPAGPQPLATRGPCLRPIDLPPGTPPTNYIEFIIILFW